MGVWGNYRDVTSKSKAPSREAVDTAKSEPKS